MTILCLGQCVYDTYFVLDRPLVENNKVRAQEGRMCMGGPVGNASYLCGLWQADTYTMARIGNDVYGKEILQSLKSVGIHTSTMLIDDQTSTSVSSIIVNTTNGSRTIVNIPLSEKNDLKIEWPDEVDVLLFDGHELPLIKEALERYPEAIRVFDGDKFKTNTLDILSDIDYLICGQEFEREYKEQFPNHDIFSLSKEVIITMGEHGCRSKTKQYKSYPADVVDTTGAGDIFHGAFVYGVDKGWDIETCIDVASRAASKSCEKIGGMTSIPPLHDIIE